VNYKFCKEDIRVDNIFDVLNILGPTNTSLVRQDLWGKTNNDFEDDESKCSSVLGELNHYERYFKILSVVIKEAKKLNYADKIKKSLNKNKTIWDPVNLETNKTGNTEKINTLNIDGNSIGDRQEIANAFNK